MATARTNENVVVDGRPAAQYYGRRYWIADLDGGGYLTLYADRVSINAGCLEFWGRHYPQSDDMSRDKPDYDKPDSDEYMLAALPAGRWTAFYAASVIDGAPVAVDRWVEKGAGR